MTGLELGLWLAGFIWLLGAALWGSQWALEVTLNSHDSKDASARRRALRMAWFTPIWPAPAIALLARNVRDEIAPDLAKAWDDAWTDAEPAEIEPTTVATIEPIPGQWEQPPSARSLVCHHRRVHMAICLDCHQLVY